MSKRKIVIDSISGGLANYVHGQPDGTFLYGLGIDPEYPLGKLRYAPSGKALSPIVYTAFSGANVNSTPVAIITTPKNTNIYTVLNNGRLVSYSSSLGSETLIGTVTGSQAKGAFYYNNYIYITGTGASGTDVSRYGPLSNSPTLTNGVWTGATLGSQTALTNTTYPAFDENLSLPIFNHWGHVHVDGAAYFCDSKNGQGLIHKIKTTKTTDEGDTNDGSAYSVLDLPLGFHPVDIESYGTDLVIAAISSLSSTINSGNAALFFWDTISNTFYRQIEIPDPYVTAIINQNGNLRIFTSLSFLSCRMSTYIGGGSFQNNFSLPGTLAPYQGAIDVSGGRLFFGGTCPLVNQVSVLSTKDTIYAYGSRGTNQNVGLIPTAYIDNFGGNLGTALKIIGNVNNSFEAVDYPKIIYGNDGEQIYSLDVNSATEQFSLFATPLFSIGRPFIIKKISFSMADSITADTLVRVHIYKDADNTINFLGRDSYGDVHTTDFQLGTKNIVIEKDLLGKSDFWVEFTFESSGGSGIYGISLPIIIDLEILDIDDPQ